MKIICLGDSLTYGLGVSVDLNWVSLIGKDSGHQIINKGISGDTTGGMLARLERDVLRENPDMLFLMGGSNDFIMGCEPPTVKANIMAMVHQAYAARLKVVMSTELNGDIAHTRPDWQHLSDFEAVARKNDWMSDWLKEFCKVFQTPCVDLHDQFAEAIRGQEQEYFFDGVHPNAKGHRLIADIILASGFLK